MFTTRVGTIRYWHPNRLLKHSEEPGTNVIAELADDTGSWSNTKLRLAGAFSGTSLTAVLFTAHEEVNTRLYYQAKDLSLKEHCHNNKGWFIGQFVVHV